MVVQGWAELVAWMQERSAAGALDVEAVWEQFRALAATSEQPGLPALAERFHAAPAKDRLALAGTIAGMLGPVEWPVAWREPGRRVAKTLRDLTDATVGYFTSSTSDSSLHSVMDEHIALLGTLALQHACLLLTDATQCRRDQLATVASLCSIGIRVLAPRLMPPSSSAERARAAIAFGTYVEAARAMNKVSGKVLFTQLDWQIEEART